MTDMHYTQHCHECERLRGELARQRQDCLNSLAKRIALSRPEVSLILRLVTDARNRGVYSGPPAEYMRRCDRIARKLESVTAWMSNEGETM